MTKKQYLPGDPLFVHKDIDGVVVGTFNYGDEYMVSHTTDHWTTRRPIAVTSLVGTLQMLGYTVTAPEPEPEPEPEKRALQTGELFRFYEDLDEPFMFVDNGGVNSYIDCQNSKMYAIMYDYRHVYDLDDNKVVFP